MQRGVWNAKKTKGAGAGVYACGLLAFAQIQCVSNDNSGVRDGDPVSKLAKCVAVIAKTGARGS